MADGRSGPTTDAEKIGLPPRPFLYTIDQISVMTDLTEHNLITQHIYFEGRTVGSRQAHQMIARNLNVGQPLAKPDWRVLDREFVRWMKKRGYKYYDTGVFRQ